MSNVRVTYSGLIAFIISISSVFTGLIFTLTVTRQLSQLEFGMWSLIGSLTAYVFVVQPIIGYWVTREVARDQNSAKTAFASNNVMMMLGIIIYFIIAHIIGNQSDADLNILYFAAILIPVNFVRTILSSIGIGFKPHIVQYGLAIFEISKIILGLLLVYYLELGLEGAILTITLATIASIIIQAFYVKEKIVGNFERDYLKKWLKLFWLPSYPQIARIIKNSDIVAFTFLTSSVNGLAYWGAANAVAQAVIHASKINQGMYPKLLGGGKKEYLQENLTYFFYLVFPLASMVIVFAKPALFALNPLYDLASNIVIVLVFSIFQMSINKIFVSGLQGIEKVDLKPDATFKDHFKSKLFYLPTIQNFRAAWYLGILVVTLIYFKSQGVSELELVFIWAIVDCISRVPQTVYLYTMVKREFSPKIKKKYVIKYFVIATIVFGGVFVLMDNTLTYHISIFQFLPEFLAYVILAISGYLGITYISDLRTRKLINNIINELKQKIMK